MPLSEEQIGQFLREGFLTVQQVVPERYITDLQGEIERAIDEQAKTLYL
ncbi:uncharacterized protein METZ01_LOCUS494711, partial [marine metagenome]